MIIILTRIEMWQQEIRMQKERDKFIRYMYVRVHVFLYNNIIGSTFYDFSVTRHTRIAYTRNRQVNVHRDIDATKCICT